MAKNFKMMLAFVLALVMLVGTAIPAFAAETVWQGDIVKLNITEGEEPYVYALGQDPANNRWYYETSNHTVKKEVTGGGAIHIFPMVDTTKVSGEWTPDGIYQSGVSNFDVMYCCDAVTGTESNAYYKRVNLEDSEYVSEADAKRLRAIVENAYPYVSVEEAKAALKEAGFAQADELDRSELIAATQAAIWTIANPDSGDSYRYNKTATTAQKLTWGGYMHEFADEITNFSDSKTSKKYLSNPNGVGTRVNALIDFYLAMEGVDAKAGQIVITKLDVSESKVGRSDGLYPVELNVSLNQGADENDDVVFNVYIDGEVVDTVKVTDATEYTVNFDAPADADIKVVVSGTQNLERGVYFYQPKPADLNGDGVATSREVSQNLIAVASGETPVYAEMTITIDTPPTIRFNSGDASNISFMLIDKATGAVEFLYKIDIENQTSFEIPTAEGKISAVFVKQSTSGMFWFAEEVDEDVQNAVIECLKDNNPSYKGHNAIAFGAGNHDLEFKKNKFVTYTFDGAAVVENGDETKAETPVENDTKDDTKDETKVETETETEVETEAETTKKNNGKGNNKNKNKNKNK